MKTGVLLIMLVVALLLGGLTHAQSGNGYDLTWNTIDNGGGTIENGGYILNGTIGQPEASTPLSNGGYTPAGGFWSSGAAQYRIYLPLVLKG